MKTLFLTYALETIPSTIRHLKALKGLYLEYMPNLVELPDVFEELPNLEGLTICFAGLTSLPKSISSSKKLKQLSIRHCPISTLPTSLPESLEELTVINTKISSVPASLFQHPRLKEIDLGSNQIKKVQVPTQLSRKTPFKIIDLSFNEIKQLPIEFFKLPIKKLKMGGNPLTKTTSKRLIQKFPGIDLILYELFSAIRQWEDNHSEDEARDQ
ncbi:MAG: hypothetical protein D6732_13020 [Methanobacteriota archaeon]|nr:MAG: hypothetical protein D6732_13020 [Euryarchaeota archaeon]